MPTTPRIRTAQASDAEAVAELVTELGTPSDSRRIAPLLEAIGGREGHRVFVTVDGDNRATGLLHAALVPLLESGRSLQIFALVVHPRQRRKGLARALAQAVEDWAKVSGCDVLALRCNSKRTEAHRFWESAGYAHTKTQFAFRKAVAR